MFVKSRRFLHLLRFYCYHYKPSLLFYFWTIIFGLVLSKKEGPELFFSIIFGILIWSFIASGEKEIND